MVVFTSKEYCDTGMLSNSWSNGGRVVIGQTSTWRAGDGAFGEGACSVMRQTSSGLGLAGEWGAREWRRCRGGNWTDLFRGIGPVVGTPAERRAGMSAPRCWECSVALTGGRIRGWDPRGASRVPQLDTIRQTSLQRAWRDVLFGNEKTSTGRGMGNETDLCGPIMRQTSTRWGFGRPPSTPCAWSTAHRSRNHGHRCLFGNETDLFVGDLAGGGSGDGN